MTTWIRVDASLPRDPDVAKLADIIGVKKAEAVGLLVCLWTAIGEQRRDGNLSDLSPQIIETWAGYRPRCRSDEGKFAAAFTEIFTKNGYVNESGPIGLRTPNRRSGVPWWTRLRIFARDGRVCRNCGATQDLQIDHIEPWILGGSDHDSNLQVLCRTCNMKKGPRAGAGSIR